MTIPKKECSQCHVVKPIDEFTRRIACPDNHLAECKECEKLRREKRKQELSNYIKCF